MNADDFYAVLEVAPHARQAVIDAAFTVLREDACRDETPNGHRRLVALNRAHHTLSDPERRRAYDERRVQVTGPAAGGTETLR